MKRQQKEDKEEKENLGLDEEVEDNDENNKNNKNNENENNKDSEIVSWNITIFRYLCIIIYLYHLLKYLSGAILVLFQCHSSGFW